MILSLRFIIKLFIKTFIGNFHPVILWRFGSMWFIINFVLYLSTCYLLLVAFLATNLGSMIWSTPCLDWWGCSSSVGSWWFSRKRKPTGAATEGKRDVLGVNSKDVPIYLFFSYSRYTVYIFICYYMYLFFGTHIFIIYLLFGNVAFVFQSGWHKQGICPLQCYPKACETFWLQLNLIWFLQRGSTTIENSWDKNILNIFPIHPQSLT